MKRRGVRGTSGTGKLFVIGLLAIVVTAAAVVGLTVAGDGDEEPSLAVERRYEPRPDEIVASTDDGRLLLVGAGDGRTRRVLASGLPADLELAVAPDGQRVYYSSGLSPIGARCPESVLATIDVDGRRGARLARGRRPAISPDGKRLAYARTGRTMPCSSTVVVRLLDSGTEEQWKAKDGEGIAALSWAPDSRHLLVVSNDDDDGSPLVNRLLDTESPGMLADGARIPLPGARGISTLVLGTLGDGNIAAIASDPVPTREGVITDGELESPTRERLVAIDARTGDELTTIYRFPPGRWGDPGYLPRPVYDDRRFTSDRSARHFLWVVHANTTRGGVLSRYSVADARPTPIADGIVEAAWLPAESTVP